MEPFPLRLEVVPGQHGHVTVYAWRGCRLVATGTASRTFYCVDERMTIARAIRDLRTELRGF